MTREQPAQLTISLPIDAPLTEGFGVSVGIHLLAFFLLLMWLLSQPPEQPVTHIPMEMIRLGLGNGAGSGGNLSATGNPLKGPTPQNPLEDASRQEQTRQKVTPPDQYQPGQRVVPSNTTSAQQSRDSSNAKGKKNLGSPNGSPNGTGLAGTGPGSGSGSGFGIDWGGGGNRTVLNKVLPPYPPGVEKNAQIRFRFFVNADGVVENIYPTQKGDPRLEEAGMNALRQWRFNRSPTQKQVGEITFKFVAD